MRTPTDASPPTTSTPTSKPESIVPTHIKKELQKKLLFYMSRPVSRVLSRTTIYLALPLPTGSSHLLGTAGPAFKSPYHGVAPDRVYSVHMSPCDGWALTPPFHPYRAGARRYISVALVRGSPLAGVTRYPCPVEPGLSSCTGFRLVPAVVRPTHGAYCSHLFRLSQVVLVNTEQKPYNL